MSARPHARRPIACGAGGSVPPSRVRPRRPDRRASGQMAVELAVLVPVIIVVALTVANLARYVELCAQFDRVAPDLVIAHGIAPAGESSAVGATGEVEAALADAMDGTSGLGAVEVRVSAAAPTGEPATGPGITFPVSPLLTEYACTLTYHPWPSSFVIAGVAYESPVALTHERRIVVDRFRPGVVV